MGSDGAQKPPSHSQHWRPKHSTQLSLSARDDADGSKFVVGLAVMIAEQRPEPDATGEIVEVEHLSMLSLSSALLLIAVDVVAVVGGDDTQQLKSNLTRRVSMYISCSCTKLLFTLLLAHYDTRSRRCGNRVVHSMVN